MIRCPWWSSGDDACPDSTRLGFDPLLRHRIFGITNCHIFNRLLYLVANVISEFEMYEDMLSPLRGECDSNQVSLLVYQLQHSPGLWGTGVRSPIQAQNISDHWLSHIRPTVTAALNWKYSVSSRKKKNTEHGQSTQQGGHCLFRQHIENGKVAEIGSHFPLRNPVT